MATRPRPPRGAYAKHVGVTSNDRHWNDKPALTPRQKQAQRAVKKQIRKEIGEEIDDR